MSKKLCCNDARSYQRSVNRVADGSRLVPKQFDDEIPWSPAPSIGSRRLLLISQSQHEVKIGLQSEFKSSRFWDQVHGCIFPKKYAACRASSLLISPHYSTAADPYLPPTELRFLRKFQPFRIDGSTKWFTRIFGPRRESGRDPTLRGRPWSAPHLRLRNCSIYL